MDLSPDSTTSPADSSPTNLQQRQSTFNDVFIPNLQTVHVTGDQIDARAILSFS